MTIATQVFDVKKHSTAPLILEADMELNASPESVFQLITQPEGILRWGPGLKKVELDSAEITVGSKRHCSMAMGKFVEEIVWWKPESGYAYALVEGPMKMKDHVSYFLLKPSGSGTNVEYRMHAKLGLSGVMMKPLIRRMLTEGFHSLVETAGGGSFDLRMP